MKLLLLLLFVAPLVSAVAQEAVLQVPPGTDEVELDVYGNIVLLDRDAAMVTIRFSSTAEIRTLGGRGWGDTEFDRPAGIWVQNGIDLYVADYGNHRVQRFDRTLNYVSTLFTRDNPDPAKRFGYPTGVALSRLGELFILDGENVRVLKVNRANEVERSFGGIDAGRGRLRAPTDIAVGPADRVYVVDRGRVVVFDTFGNYVRELMPLSEEEDARIAVDERGVVVLQAGMVTCFDRDDRLVRAVDSGTILSAPARKPVDVALHAGRLYLLAGDALWAVADPRAATDGKSEQ